MHKPHSTSATLHFVRASKNGISYIDEGHYIQFDGNSITIRPLLSSDPPFGSIDYLIGLFKAPLRKYKANHSNKLQLYLNECPDLVKGLLHQIGSEIATNFKHLKELTIQFFLCDNLTAEGLRYFLTPIAKNLQGLKKLSLSINCCAKFNDKGIDAIRSLLLRRLTGLQELTLNLCPELVTVEDGECIQTSFDSNLFDRLNRFPHYSINQQIHAPIQVTSKGVRLLSKSVGQYLKQKLQKLVLTLPHPNDYNPVQNLRSNKKAIQNLKKLEVLHLNFCTSYVEEDTIQGTSKPINEEIASIAHCISQNMRNLHYLSLDFSFLLSITNQTLMKIGSSIFPNLPHLRGFAIFCQYDVPISDSGIISFVKLG